MKASSIFFFLVPSTGHLLDYIHRPLLLCEGGDWDFASRGRSRCPAVVRHLYPGRLPDRSPHHVPSGQHLPRVRPGSRMRG